MYISKFLYCEILVLKYFAMCVDWMFILGYDDTLKLHTLSVKCDLCKKSCDLYAASTKSNYNKMYATSIKSPVRPILNPCTTYIKPHVLFISMCDLLNRYWVYKVKLRFWPRNNLETKNETLANKMKMFNFRKGLFTPGYHGYHAYHGYLLLELHSALWVPLLQY